MPDREGYPTADEMDLGSVMAALADQHRRRVVSELAADPAVSERACSSFELPLAKSTQSHLFNVLVDSGLITSADHGNYRSVALRREVVNSRFPGLIDLLAKEVHLGAESHGSLGHANE